MLFINDDTIINAEGSNNKIEFIKKYADPQGGWKAYEFETDEQIVFQVFHENGELADEYTSSLFRLEILEQDIRVLIAERNEYLVMEDVSYAFDIDKLVEQATKEDNNIFDDQEEYNQWLAEE